MKFAIQLLLLCAMYAPMLTNAQTQQIKTNMKAELKPLPYAYDALEPWLDKATLELHHDKHQATYVNNFNIAIEKIPEEEFNGCIPSLLKKLDSIDESVRTAIRNNGGGVFNHEFYWEGLSPEKTEPSKELLEAIDKSFGSVEKMKEVMTQKALATFGSGYAWLCVDEKGLLKIMTTPNQDNPFSAPCKCGCKLKPIFCIDVWEHSYYLKYKNLRAEYLKAIWNVVNWQKLSCRYACAMKKQCCSKK